MATQSRKSSTKASGPTSIFTYVLQPIPQSSRAEIICDTFTLGKRTSRAMLVVNAYTGEWSFVRYSVLNGHFCKPEIVAIDISQAFNMMEAMQQAAKA